MIYKALLNIFIILYLFVLSISCSKKNSELKNQALKADSVIIQTNQQTSTPLLITLFIKTESTDSIESVSAIYPICQFFNNEYKDASLAEDQEDKNNIVQPESSVLHKFNQFSLLQNSKLVGEAKVDSIILVPFLCTGLYVGATTLSSDPNYINAHARFECIAINSTSFNKLNPQSYKELPDTLLSNYNISNYLKSIYSKMNVPNNYLDSIKIHFKCLYDFNKDTYDEYVLGTGINTDSIVVSIVSILNINDSGNINSIYELKNEESNSSWGEGHRIIDLIDIDNDGILEFIIEFSGYEIVEYQIYKFINNTFKKVFSGASYGC